MQIRFALSVVLALSLASSASHAQESSTDAGAAPSTIESLTTLRAELVKLEKQRARATGDNQQILEDEVKERRDQLQEQLTELVAEVKNARKVGEAPTDLVAAGKKAIEAELGTIRRELKQLQKTVRKLRAEEPEDPKLELERQEQLRHDEALRDQLLARYHTATGLLGELQIDATSANKELDQFLTERVNDARSVYKLALDQKKELAGQAAPTNDEEKEAREKTAQAIEAKVSAAKLSLEQALELMEERGMETSEHRQFLIEASGEITADVFDKEVAMGLVQKWIENGKEWIVENGPALIFKALLFFIIILVFRLLAGVTRRVVRKGLSSGRIELSKLLREFFEGLAAKAVMLLGVLIAMSQLGIELGPLLAGLGVIGFIVGFALQSTLSNFASGLMILIYRPYDVDDLISVAGETGKVAEMTLVSTTILTLDHQRLVIPNNKVWGDVIRNVTAEPIRRVDLVFGIGYSDDIEKARAVLAQILEDNEMVLSEPVPMVKLHNLGDSSVDFVVRPWCQTDDYWDVHWDVTRTVKERFDADGISIPFPQRDVHLYKESA